MKYRVLIFEDNDTIRSVLYQFIGGLGYEVFTFTDSSLCPLHKKQFCDCPHKSACSDIIISDLNMPKVNGTEFIKDMWKKGCKVNNIAIMSGDLTSEATEEFEKLGCHILKKPFDFEVLKDWLKNCEKVIQENRKLSNWIVVGGNQSLEN
jgi:DNA-binding NtrC family response regulator